jgi:hypothetical protein
MGIDAMRLIRYVFAMVRFTQLLIILFAASLSNVTFADVGRPMIEVGGGMDVHPGQTVSVLLRVSIEGVTIGTPRGKTFSSMVLARMKGDLALSAQSDGRPVSFMDIEFVPWSGRTGDGLSGVEYRALPMRFGTNIRMNQDTTIRVDLAGAETSFLGPSGFSDKALIFAKIAADALGYKVATHLTDTNDFHGVNVAAVNGEVGLVYALGTNFKARVVFGGTADLNIGGNVGTGFALESDLGAYNEISLDIKKFMRLFIRNGLNSRINGGVDTDTEYQLMMGATFIF